MNDSTNTPNLSDSTETVCLDGWNAIVQAFESIYPEQKEPLHHLAAMVPWILGGNDPLDGVSVYDGGDFYHFVTFGLSELYQKESSDPEYSGFGFEFTLKLKKMGLPEEEENLEIRTMVGILQSLARVSFEQNEIFAPYEYIYTGQETGIDSKGQSAITGFITLPDKLGTLDTPNGKVEFVQLVGVTNAELQRILDHTCDVKQLAEKIGTDLTDYQRSSIQ